MPTHSLLNVAFSYLPFITLHIKKKALGSMTVFQIRSHLHSRFCDCRGTETVKDVVEEGGSPLVTKEMTKFPLRDKPREHTCWL